MYEMFSGNLWRSSDGREARHGKYLFNQQMKFNDFDVETQLIDERNVCFGLNKVYYGLMVEHSVRGGETFRLIDNYHFCLTI